MAEGFLRHSAGDRFEAASAGSQPTQLNPYAVRVMKEVGVDISGQRSKDVWDFGGQRFNFVITVCDKAKETCPIFPGISSNLHWNIDDPAGAEGTESSRLAVFRRVRDEIEGRVLEFVANEGGSEGA
jgi:arsenate reductase (thioredoxin)